MCAYRLNSYWSNNLLLGRLSGRLWLFDGRWTRQLSGRFSWSGAWQFGWRWGSWLVALGHGELPDTLPLLTATCFDGGVCRGTLNCRGVAVTFFGVCERSVAVTLVADGEDEDGILGTDADTVFPGRRPHALRGSDFSVLAADMRERPDRALVAAVRFPCNANASFAVRALVGRQMDAAALLVTQRVVSIDTS